MASIFDEYNSLSGSTSAPTRSNIEEERLLYGVPKVNGTSIFDQYKSSTQPSQMVEQPVDYDWNLPSFAAHGFEGLDEKWGMSMATRDARLYKQFEDIYQLQDNPQAYSQYLETELNIPGNFDDLDTIEQQKILWERFPNYGTSDKLEEFNKRRLAATNLRDEQGKTRKQVENNIINAVRDITEWEKRAPAQDPKSIAAWANAKGWGPSFRFILDNPKFAAQASAQSFGEVSPMIATGILASIFLGPAGGAVAGGLGSWTIADLHGLDMALEFHGIDPRNPQQLIELMDNPELTQKINTARRKYSETHGVAAVITGGISGWLMAGRGILFGAMRGAKPTIPQSLGRAGTVLGFGTASEMAEEAAAIKRSGMWDPDKSPKEVLMEGVAAGMMHAPEAAVSLGIDTVQRARGRDRAAKGEVLPDEPPPPIVETKDLELEPEGTPLGVDVGEPGLDVETPEVAIEETSVDAPVVDETVIDEEVPRKPLGDADPISQRGFYAQFQDMLSKVLYGSEDSETSYNNFVQQVNTNFDETPDEFHERNEEFRLLDEKSPGQSVIVADDGTLIPVSEQLTHTDEEGIKSVAVETEIQVIAALRRGSKLVNENFNNFADSIKRYHQHYGEIDKLVYGKDTLDIIFDLGGGGMEASAAYDPINHELIVNAAHLMSGKQTIAEEEAGIPSQPRANLSATAIHELVHMKLWTLFKDEALQVVKNTPEYINLANLIGSEQFENGTPEEKEKIARFILEERDTLVQKEAFKNVDEFGRKLIKPLRTEIIEFLNSRFKDAREIGDNPGRYAAQSLNLNPGSDLFKRISRSRDTKKIFNILAGAAEAGERIIGVKDGQKESLTISVGYHIIHELLAYNSMTLETLLERGKVPTTKQKAFIEKFLRIAKQVLSKITGDIQLTREDVTDFINTMFLETAGAMEPGIIRETKLYKTAQEQRKPVPLKGEATVGPGISRMVDKEDEKIDLSKRRFVKQVAGAAAGAAVDPTILAEPAAAAATTVAKGVSPSAIATVYRFAVSVPVETREGEIVEGEAIVDIEYDRDSNTISVQTLDEDASVITEEKFQVPIEDPDMRQVDDFAAQIIKTGVNPMDPKGSQIFDPKAVYSVQAPIRDPHHEELADEDRVMNEQDLEEYSEIDADFMGGLASPRDYRGGLDPINPNKSDVNDPSYQAQFTEYGGTPPRVTLEGELVGPAEKLMTTPRAGTTPMAARNLDDSLIRHPRDKYDRARAGRDWTRPTAETDKVIDKVTETIGQNTEALGEIKETVDVIKEAIKQISGMTLEDVEGKPVEGEVIPAKRKREPGMAEEETMQELRDALAGSEERLERLQDVGRDEDVETIEEYEAEIEAYKKDIKDLKEELKEVGATLPRKKGEGPPIISRMVEPEPQAEKQISSILLHHGGPLETAGKLKPPSQLYYQVFLNLIH